MKINRNAIVVIDRDGFSSKNRLNKTKSRINVETKTGNCWITKGREIENYLSKGVMEQFLSNYSDNQRFVHSNNSHIGALIKRHNRGIKLNYDGNKPKLMVKLRE